MTFEARGPSIRRQRSLRIPRQGATWPWLASSYSCMTFLRPSQSLWATYRRPADTHIAPFKIIVNLQRYRRAANTQSLLLCSEYGLSGSWL